MGVKTKRGFILIKYYKLHQCTEGARNSCEYNDSQEPYIVFYMIVVYPESNKITSELYKFTYKNFKTQCSAKFDALLRVFVDKGSLFP